LSNLNVLFILGFLEFPSVFFLSLFLTDDELVVDFTY